MSNSPSSRQQQQTGGYPQQQTHPAGTIYGVAMTQEQQVHQPGVPETYTQQYPPGYAAPPLSAYGVAHYHAAYPPPLAYPYVLPTQGGYTATHFYPPPPLPQGPLPHPYAAYPYPIYASSTAHSSPTSQIIGEKVVSSSENVGDYDQYANKNSSSPLKHDAIGMTTGSRPSSLAKKDVDGVKGTDKSPPDSRSNPTGSTIRAKPMHLHVDTQFGTQGPATAESRYNADDMVSRVKPMRSDFHFYAEDHKKDIIHDIESNVDASDPVELMSELNERLLKRWEDETDKVRNLYMAKEEADRTRFMNEEEIESRHCATLTSRPKSVGSTHSDKDSKSTPKNEADNVNNDNGQQQQGDHDDHDNEEEDKDNEDDNGDEKEEDDYESPSKKLKEDDEKGNGQKSLEDKK
jgi:hypothetical protein